MPKVIPKRKLTKQEKRRKKELKERQARLLAARTEQFISKFSPAVQEHLKGEFFKKIDERKQQRLAKTADNKV